MEDIETKVIKVLKKEEQKINEEIKNFDSMISEADEVFPLNKPTYTFPLMDTIGRTYYNVFNRKVIVL